MNHILSRILRKSAKKKGLPPGTLVHVGKEKKTPISIDFFDYTSKNLVEKKPQSVADITGLTKTRTSTWVNITGIHDTTFISDLGAKLELHPLLLEDVVNTNQRPKMDEYDNCLFLVLKMLRYDRETKEIDVEQISIIISKNYVLSFQEQEGDVFDAVRDRIRAGKGRIRKMGSDYLAYALIDAIVDHYFIVLEDIGEEIEDLEAELVGRPDPDVLAKIHELKRELILLRKSVWPLREVISGTLRTESKIITKPTEIYLRDVYDHTIQVIDTVETFRDLVSGMLDTYLSSVSNRMNEVMKVLTIIATIFIPLTFIAGVYGMNFQHMPELTWRWGYYATWAVMLFIGVALFYYFKKKGWI